MINEKILQKTSKHEDFLFTIACDVLKLQQIKAHNITHKSYSTINNIIETWIYSATLYSTKLQRAHFIRLYK